MRLKIQKVRFKNLLSFGNAWTELEFIDGHIALIMGKNGDGKSTFYEALYFGLYGKPFRKINKDGLINTTNGKQTVVEIELIADGKPIKIVRGIKPGIFEIYLNGVLKNQDASAWDYQGWLESTILRMDERTFKQLVILGSTSFVPFMNLKTWERRSVIEDILSLGVYSQMLSIVKKRTGEIAQIKEDTSRAIDGKKIQLAALSRSLKDLTDVINTSASGYVEQLDSTKQKLVELEEKKAYEISCLTPEVQRKMDRENSAKLAEQKARSDKLIHLMTSSLGKINADIKFFSDNDVCPTCHQPIDEAFRDGAIEKSRKEIEEKNEAVLKLKAYKEDYTEQLELIQTFINSWQKSEQEIISLDRSIASHKNEIKFLESKIQEISGLNRAKVTELEESSKEISAKIVSFSISMDKILQEISDFMELENLFKDTGVKSKIIAEHIPIINALVKKYLEILDFPVQMTFNDDFSEVIRSRFNEEFSYGNLSSGEKMRIDLALLFTWREITRLSNSASCNLLILDEVGDSSLDADGFDSFMKILSADKASQSVVVISHKAYGISGFVDQIIEISKADGFSKISKATANEPDEMIV